MYAVAGTLFLVLAVLGFAVVLLVSRRPNPPAWITHTLTQEIVSISVVSLIGFGTAFAFQTIGAIKEEPLTMMQLALIALILIAFAFVWRRLKVGATLAEYERQTGIAMQPAVDGSGTGHVSVIDAMSPSVGAAAPEDPGSPTRPRTPHLRKKAA